MDAFGAANPAPLVPFSVVGGKEVIIYKNTWPLGTGKRLIVGVGDGKTFEDQCREFVGSLAPTQPNEKIRLYCFSSLGDARVIPSSVPKLLPPATTHRRGGLPSSHPL